MSPSPYSFNIKNLYVQDVDNYVILYGTDNDANTQLMLLLMPFKKNYRGMKRLSRIM